MDEESGVQSGCGAWDCHWITSSFASSGRHPNNLIICLRPGAYGLTLATKYAAVAKGMDHSSAPCLKADMHNVWARYISKWVSSYKVQSFGTAHARLFNAILP